MDEIKAKHRTRIGSIYKDFTNYNPSLKSLQGAPRQDSTNSQCKALPETPLHAQLKVNNSTPVEDLVKTTYPISTCDPLQSPFVWIRNEWWGGAKAGMFWRRQSLYALRSVAKPTTGCPPIKKITRSTNILQVVRVFEHGEEIHFLYEHVDISLADLLAVHGRLSDEQAAYICGEVLTGLEALYEELRLAHGDVRKSSIMLSCLGNVKLGGMGETQLLQRQCSPADDLRQLGSVVCQMLVPQEPEQVALLKMSGNSTHFYALCGNADLGQLRQSRFITSAAGQVCLVKEAYECTKNKSYICL